jgi:iron complex outermembrane receptor protein
MSNFVVWRFSSFRPRSAVPVRSFVRHVCGLIPLLAFATALQAQTGLLTGRVTDASNNQPLAGVQIRLGSTLQGAVTREDGSYRLQATPGTYVVRAARIGFATRTDTVAIIAGETATRDFAMASMLLNLDPSVVIGSRATDRTVLEAPVAIDVISADDIRSTGLTETSQIIQMLAPSLNFPRPSVNDGTDHVRPATLRGLGPDQTLVLINGKRRHTTALVHVNQSVGRGSTSVDLNAIPANAIERIEILRDGAAAQYGSDAIAGVINIVLKSTAQTSVSGTYGQVRSTPDGGPTFKDGTVKQFDANFGRVIRNDGFFHIAGEIRDRERTNRARVDTSLQCVAPPSPPTPGCVNVPANADRYDSDLLQSWQGDPETTDFILFANTEIPIMTASRVYAFGGYSTRDGTAPGFFRRSLDDRTVRGRYANGFLPLIGSEIKDASGALGVRGSWMDWNWDLGGVYGGNSFAFSVDHSVNTSLGMASPTSFEAGELRFKQGTLNLDLSRSFAGTMIGTVNVAAGAEARRDNYQLERGDPASFQVGTQTIIDGPNAGKPAAPFAQVFPGFRPEDEADASRTNYGAYAELEATPFAPWLISVAGRAERYTGDDNDWSTTDGKIASRLEIGPGVAIRGAVQTGFRAPSLAQSYFSSVATNFVTISGVSTPFEIRTFAVGSPGGQLLGAKPLKPEQSKSVSLGLTMRPFETFSISTDYYKIAIEDRIVFSGNFLGSAVETLLATNGIPGVNGARYFTNAIDTKTEGLDVVLNYGIDLRNAGLLRFTGGYNRNRTVVTHVDPTPPQLAALSSALFDRVQRNLIQRGQPRDNISLTLNHQVANFVTNVHASRFGEIKVFQPAVNGSGDQTFSKKWVTDLSLGYRFFDQLQLTVGGNNIFDVYPDTVIAPNQTRGIYLYAGASPFGFNGRYFYIRAAYDLPGLGNPFSRDRTLADRPRAVAAAPER